MFEILCLQITSAGQLCGFSVRGRPGFGFIFVDLDLLYVSGHTDCLTLIKPLARWDKESSQGPHGTAVSFCPGLSVVTEVNLLSLIWPQSPHASYHMYLLLHWVCFWCLKVCVLSYKPDASSGTCLKTQSWAPLLGKKTCLWWAQGEVCWCVGFWSGAYRYGCNKFNCQDASNRDFPGGPVVKTPHFQYALPMGAGSILGQGTKNPHAGRHGPKN